MLIPDKKIINLMFSYILSCQLALERWHVFVT